jgi:hypothetical protein
MVPHLIRDAGHVYRAESFCYILPTNDETETHLETLYTK